MQEKCPNCNAVLEITPEMYGVRLECPSCHSQFVIQPPAPATVENVPPAPPAPPAPPSPAPSMPMEQQAVPQRGKSVGSVVCGIIGLVFCGLGIIPAIIGLILGIKKRCKPGIVLNSIALGMSLVLLFCGVCLLPALGKARDKARAISCTNNLKQCALSAILFANDNDDYLPRDMEEAAEALGGPNWEQSKMIQCPCGGTIEYLAPDRRIRLSYIRNPDTYPIFVCPNKHDGKCLVAFADGHVESVTPDEFEELKWSRR